MSRVFKSNYVQVGTPKPLENTFIIVNTAQINNAQPQMSEEEQRAAIQAEYERRANNIIEDAKQMYLKIIEEANYEAKCITDEAAEAAEFLKQSEAARGFDEGYQQGYMEGKREAERIINEAAGIKAWLDGRRETLYREAEEEIMNLVLDISKKVIGDELTQNKDAIFSIIGQALSKCAFKNSLIIRVSPVDYEYAFENKDRVSALIEGVCDFEIISDPSLGQGGCVIETPSGEINSSVEIQMREVEKVFSYMLRNE